MLAAAIENEWGQVNTGFNLAQALFEGGQWGQALSTVQEAVTIAEEHELPMLLTILLVRGTIYRALRALEKALADREWARRLYKSFPNPAFAVVTAVDLCADHAAAGQWPEAYRYARETRDTDGWSWLFGAFHYWRVVEALLHEGAVEQARPAAQAFGERVGDNPPTPLSGKRPGQVALTAGCCANYAFLLRWFANVKAEINRALQTLLLALVVPSHKRSVTCLQSRTKPPFAAFTRKLLARATWI